MDSNQLSLIHDPKPPSSFNSAHWKSGYNPDLVIVTSNIADLCQQIVTDPIPASQHWLIGIQVNAAVRPTSVPFWRHFNCQKADWTDFSEDLERKIEHIAPVSSNYDRFVLLVKKSARKHIPQGCREQYIPGLSKENSELYEEYITMFNDDPFADSTTQVGEEVMESISQERHKSWQTLIEPTDKSKNRKKALSTICKLRRDPKAPMQ